MAISVASPEKITLAAPDTLRLPAAAQPAAPQGDAITTRR
jgi:hypothetical protein